MNDNQYTKHVEKILTEDKRYSRYAYFFVSDAVAYSTRKVSENSGQERRHISGQQLLEGFKEYALKQFGPLALEVLNNWGLYKTEDIGNIVFNLVEHGLLGAQENDVPDDFSNVYDFRTTFLEPFIPHNDDTPKSTIKIA